MHFQPFPQSEDGARGQGRGSLFAALAATTNVWPGRQCRVFTAQPGEFCYAQTGLDRDGQ